MFDRALISVGDNYKILVAENHVPEDALRLLNQNRLIRSPRV
jgi:putative restriction endonuclease